MAGTSTSTDAGIGLARLNSLPRQELISKLRVCLDVPRWAYDVAVQRPFVDTDALYTAGDAAATHLSEQELESALAAHPRIGERATGKDTSSNFSRSEQSGMDSAAASVQDALRAGNEEYERRFGHVYLVCASGHSAEELLEILRCRLDNDPATEKRIVVDELRKIAKLRMARLIGE